MSSIIKAGFGPRGLPIDYARFECQENSDSGMPSEIAAAGIIDRARMEADVIIRTARADADTICEQARQAGYQQGHDAGLTESAQKAHALMARLESDIAASAEETQAFFDSLEPELLKLCVESVEKIVRHEIRTDPKVVLRVIKACLRRVTESDEVRVRVNPSELAAVRAQRDELLQIAEGVRAINIMDDRRVSPGGCTVETATGDFDATVETQMEKIERKLVETFKNECSETGIESGEISQGDRPY